jgi:NADPH:quinone reductase-like Zn-dependent oxidoreductase
MKAAVRDRYGPPSVVRIEDVERPAPTGDQLLVRVRAASVNRGDLDGLGPRWQFTRLFLGIRRPRSRRLGIDAAGVVEAVGPDVKRFRVGDRVFADLFSAGDGSFAEYVCARERFFLPIPEDLSFEDASTLPHSSVLAMQGLRRGSRIVGPGDRVLVDGASGNVGPFVVQIAKAMGAEVTGVARADKLNFVRSLGADHVIDYTTVDFTRGRQRYDWIVATDSHHSFVSIARVLRRGGIYRAMGGSARWILTALLVAPLLSRLVGRSMGLLLWKPFAAADVERVTALIAAGKVRPRIERRYPLAEIVDALRWVDDGHARGKVIVVP